MRPRYRKIPVFYLFCRSKVRRYGMFFVRLAIYLWLRFWRYCRRGARPEKENFVIMTGADSSHYRSMLNFLCSAHIYEPNKKFLAYDLGLRSWERRLLRRLFPEVEVRVFDYSRYPDWMNIRVNAGGYAWKPVIFHEVFNDFRCTVCWADAGMILHRNIRLMERRLLKTGAYFSKGAQGRIRGRIHPGVLKRLNPSAEILDKEVVWSGFFAMRWSETTRRLADQWREWALTRECIAPPGANRSNHGFEQALLSILVQQFALTDCIVRWPHGVGVNLDLEVGLDQFVRWFGR